MTSKCRRACAELTRSTNQPSIFIAHQKAFTEAARAEPFWPSVIPSTCESNRKNLKLSGSLRSTMASSMAARSEGMLGSRRRHHIRRSWRGAENRCCSDRFLVHPWDAPRAAAPRRASSSLRVGRLTRTSFPSAIWRLRFG